MLPETGESFRSLLLDADKHPMDESTFMNICSLAEENFQKLQTHAHSKKQLQMYLELSDTHEKEQISAAKKEFHMQKEIVELKSQVMTLQNAFSDALNENQEKESLLNRLKGEMKVHINKNLELEKEMSKCMYYFATKISEREEALHSLRLSKDALYTAETRNTTLMEENESLKKRLLDHIGQPKKNGSAPGSTPDRKYLEFWRNH